MRLILKPDWDPNNPYHYHVNGQKVVVTPEDWEKYKNDPTFREVRAAVEAEQAAHPEPEYNEVENPAWRKAYQNLVNGVNLRGRDNVSQPLPQGYTRDNKGVVMDSEGNYYLPVETATNAPYFINQERGTMGHTVPVRYEQQQMPDRTIRQLRQPLPIDRVIDIGKEKEKAINDYADKYKVSLGTIFGGNEGIIELPGGYIVDSWDDAIYKRGPNYSSTKVSNNGRKFLEKYLADYIGRPVSFEYYKSPYGFDDNQLIFSADELAKFSKPLKKQQDDITRKELKSEEERLQNMLKDRKFFSEEEINVCKKYIEILKKDLNSNEPYYYNEPKKVSRSEAEKKAVIKVGDLEKLGTFAKGGKLINKCLNGGKPYQQSLPYNKIYYYSWSHPRLTSTMNTKIPSVFVSSYQRNTITPYSINDLDWLKYWYKNRRRQFSNMLWYPQFDNEDFENYFYSDFDDSKNREIDLKVFGLNNAIDYAYSLPVKYVSLKDGTRGVYYNKDKSIEIDPELASSSTNLHEHVHKINDKMQENETWPINLLNGDWIFVSPVEGLLENIYDKNSFDRYLDDPSEIYSRLMEFRRMNNLNPRAIYKKEDIQEWRKNGSLERYRLDRYSDDLLLYLFNEVADNTKLNEEINYSKRGSKLINKCQNGERVNMSKLVTNSEGTPLKVDNNLLEELDNFLIKQNVGLPLRLAILYTVVQEGSTTGSHGNGAYGYLGWRGSRIPGKGVNLMLYLYDTIFGEFNKDLWNHGGVGSGYKTAREAQQSFINATNVNDALRSLNYGYVRPELELREFRSKTKYFNEDEEVN